MRSLIRTSMAGIFLLAMSLAVISPETVRGELFRSPENGDQSVLSAPVHEAVLRQQSVDIRWEALQDCTAEVVELNFFDDVRLMAVRDRTETSPTGGCAWLGSIQEPEEGRATFVIEEGRLSGTVTLENLYYHVRPVDDGLHIVREIDRWALAPAPSMYMPSALPQEQEVVSLVNQERSLQGLHPLNEDSRLDSAARGHSVDMAQNNFFDHYSQDGRSPWDRIADAGYSCGTCGENIAAGYSTPEAVMSGWMSSSGHRANILNSSYCDIGVGYADNSGSSYRYYWTQDFGRESGVSTCSAAETYTITATAATGGKITPSGQVEVSQGGNRTFTITPDADYRIRTVLVDGTPSGRINTYTFKNVMSDHTIEARFSKKSTISLTAHDPNAAEFPVDNGRFRVTRKGGLGSSVLVSYTVGGTATAGTDYKALSGSVRIPAGSSTATIAVIPYDDSNHENAETVVVTLRTNSAYIVGSPSSATVTIGVSD